MLQVVFVSIWFLNLIFLFFKKKSKIVIGMSICLSIYVYFHNVGSNDFFKYSLIYSGRIKSEMEPGYDLLMRIGNIIGLSFQEFQGIVASVCLLLIIMIFSKLSQNYHCFFTYYFIYQYFADLNFFRNFIMRTILFFAIYMLMQKKKKIFILLLLIASLFHSSALIYIPLILVNSETQLTKKTIKIFAVSILVFCFIVFIAGNNWTWLGVLATVILGEESEKIYYYFTTSTRLGFLLYFSLYFAFLIYILSTKHKLHNSKVTIFNWTYYINLYCLISFPMIMLNTNFYRIYNNLFFLNITYSAIVLEQYERTTGKYYGEIIKLLLINYLYRLPLVQAWNQRFLILK
mgnify:CR=1 FL=1